MRPQLTSIILCIWSFPFLLVENAITQKTPLDLIILIDSSPSMEHTDPARLRIRSAQFLLDYLAAKSKMIEVNMRVGIANFGGRVGNISPLRLLQTDRGNNVLSIEKIPFTDFRPPLMFALNEFRSKSSNTGNKKAVIFFTDGSPQLVKDELTFTDKNYYFKGEDIIGDKSPHKLNHLVNKLHMEGVDIFVIAIGKANEDAKLWRSLIPSDHFHWLDSTTNLADIYYKFVNEVMEIVAEAANALTPGQYQEIKLQPYLSQVVISFLKDNSSVKIRLKNSSGRLVVAAITENLTEIYSITEPKWGKPVQASVAGGNATMWVESHFPSIVLDQISSTYVLGQPVLMRAKLLRNRKLVVDSNLRLNASIVTTPSGDTRVESMQYQANGIYSLKLTNLKESGMYTVMCEALSNDERIVTNTKPVNFKVFPVPQINEFRIDTKDNLLTVTARIGNADRLTHGTPMILRILDANIMEIDRVEFQDNSTSSDSKKGDSIYVAQIAKPRGGGSLLLELSVQGQSKDGLVFQDQRVMPIIPHLGHPTSLNNKLTRLVRWDALLAFAGGLAVFLLYRNTRLRGKSALNKASEFVKTAEALRSEGNKFYQKGEKQKAEAAFNQALETAKEASRLSSEASWGQKREILQDLLEKSYAHNLYKQREKIFELVSENKSPDQIKGLASFLFKRWVKRPNLMLEELYLLIGQPNGIQVTKMIRNVSPPAAGNARETELVNGTQRISFIMSSVCEQLGVLG